MAVTASIYGNGMLKILTGQIDLDSDTFKVLLTTSAYTPDQDAHDFRDDVTNEITGPGYTAGGATISGITCTYDGGTNECRWDFDDPTWASASFTARRMVFYKSRGGAASADELIFWVDFGIDQSVSAGTFSYLVPTNGALAVTVA
jgi:hypothetical protein